MVKEQYYTIEEVAKTLRVAYLTVYRWIQADKLTAYKAGKQYRIKETSDALNKMEIRRAVQNAFYHLMNDIKWYERRGGIAVRKES